MLSRVVAIGGIGCFVGGTVALASLPGGSVRPSVPTRGSLLGAAHMLAADAPDGSFYYGDAYRHSVPVPTFMEAKARSSDRCPSVGEALTAVAFGFLCNPVLRAEFYLTAATRDGAFTVRGADAGAQDEVFTDYASFVRRVQRLRLEPGVRVCGFTVVDVRVDETRQEAEVIWGNRFGSARTLTAMGVKLRDSRGSTLGGKEIRRRAMDKVGLNPAALNGVLGNYGDHGAPAPDMAFWGNERRREASVEVRYGSCLQIDRPVNWLERKALELSCVAHQVYSHIVFGFTTREACLVPALRDACAAGGYTRARAARRGDVLLPP